MRYREFQVRIRPLADTQPTIALPQLSAGEFPAVASVVDPSGCRYVERTANGRLYRPTRCAGSLGLDFDADIYSFMEEKAEELTVSTLAEALQSTVSKRSKERDRYTLFDPAVKQAHRMHDLADFVGSRVTHEGGGTASSDAFPLVVHDGLVWSAADEQAWLIDIDDGTIELSRHARSWLERGFRMDRLDEAKAFAKNVFGRDVIVKGSVQVLKPGFYRRDDRTLAAKGMLQTAVFSFSRDGFLVDADEETVEMWLSARAYLQSGGGIDVDKAVEVADSFFEKALVERGSMNAFGRDSFDRTAGRVFEFARARWKWIRARPEGDSEVFATDLSDLAASAADYSEELPFESCLKTLSEIDELVGVDESFKANIRTVALRVMSHQDRYKFLHGVSQMSQLGASTGDARQSDRDDHVRLDFISCPSGGETLTLLMKGHTISTGASRTDRSGIFELGYSGQDELREIVDFIVRRKWNGSA
jgi:hypothetical protein